MSGTDSQINNFGFGFWEEAKIADNSVTDRFPNHVGELKGLHVTYEQAPPASTGTKHDQGKPSLTLLPSEALIGMTRALDFGAKKYGRYNYRDGISHHRIFDACLRHLFAVLGGEEKDPESGHPHLWHALASLAMLEWMRVNRPDLNDLYQYKKSEIDDATNER